MSSTLRRHVGLGLLLFTVVALAVGQGPGLAVALAADESQSPLRGEVTLRIGWLEDPDNLNPFVGYSDSSYEIWSLQYDYLFAERPDGTRGPDASPPPHQPQEVLLPSLSKYGFCLKPR